MKKLLLIAAGLVVVLAIGLAVTVRLLIDPENVRSTIASQASAALGVPVTLEAAAVSIWPRAGVTLTGLKVGEPASLTLNTIEVATAMRALLSRRIENAELTLADSTVDLPALMATLGNLEAEPAPAPAGGAPAEAPLTLVSIDRLSFRNVRINFEKSSASVSFDSALEGDRLDVRSFELVSPVTTLTASGAVESLSARRARLAVTADPLDLDAMIALLAGAPDAQGAPAAGGARGATGPIDLTLDVTAAKGRAAGVEFRDLKTTVRVTERDVTLEPFGLGVFGGRVDGKAHLNVGPEVPQLTVAATLANIDMAAVSAHGGQPQAISGRLGGTLQASGAGADPAAALAGASGRGEFAITDGAIPNLHLVRAIVLAFGKPAPQSSASGDAFSRVAARMQLANNVVRLSSLSFESSDVSVSGDGTLALSGGVVDIAGTAMLSEALTAQAGRDLVRFTAENKRVTVPVTVRGPIGDPVVGVNAGEVLRRAATNEATSQIKKQTGSLLDRLTGKKKP